MLSRGWRLPVSIGIVCAALLVAAAVPAEQTRRSLRAAAPYALAQVQAAVPATALLPLRLGPPPVGPGLRRRVVRWRLDGVTREYVEVTPARPRGPLALVVVLHGRRQSAWRAEATQRWDAVARTGRAVVVYGAGYGGSWNAGTCCGLAVAHNIDDVTYLTEVLRRVERSQPIDRGRVDLVGFSNGGMMAYRFACTHAELISAVAVVAGSLQVPTCRPDRALSVLDLQGGRDPVVPLQGSRYSPVAGSPITAVSRSLAPWANVDRGTRDVAELIDIPHLQHVWPSPANAHLDATATIWRFLCRHPERTA